MSLENLVQEVIEIAKRAGKEILSVYYDLDNFEIESKEDNSPLTRADKLANSVIVKGLKVLEKKIPIVSEESAQIPYEERRKFDQFWLVDPLDGTKEFIKRNGEFTVNIALIEYGAPVLGVVHVPVSGDTYYAVKGKGAFHANKEKPVLLKANKYKEADAGLRIVCSRSHINQATQKYIDRYLDPQKVPVGSSLKIVLLASGKAEVYPRLGPTMEWDIGAAQVILEEAGGEVLDFDTMKPLSYNKESLLNPHFVARAHLN